MKPGADSRERVLFVDDEHGLRTTVAYLLKQEGYRFSLAASADEACKLLDRELFDLIITDIRMETDTAGLDVLRHAKQVSPDTMVILFTAVADLDTAKKAFSDGARDVVIKEGMFTEELKIRVRNVLERRRLERKLASYEADARSQERAWRIVGSSPEITAVLEMVQQVAPNDSTILIQGESGTGKELIAREIHLSSPRRDAEFVSINCGALPDQLLESELFGHMKGAFTGATATKKGLLEVADGGTLFLDEIGESSTAMQVKLLRALQEGTFRRVGGTEEVHVNLRFIAATNQDLEEMVREKRFREDLFYRISVIPIHAPPLRSHRGDIPRLAHHFLARFRGIMGKAIAQFSDEAMALLQAYRWPGNVRELGTVIERAVALEPSDTITTASLHPDVRGGAPGPAISEAPEIPGEGFDLEEHLERRREGFMRKALEDAGGVQSRAAEALGMSFRSFRYFARKYGLTSGRGTAAETEAPAE